MTSLVEKAMHQLPHILPDYMLVFAVPVLTHDPTFTAPDDPLQLKQIEKCLWLILEPLITNKEFFCYGFYKNLVERMKNHKDALKSEDELTNHVCCHLITFYYSYHTRIELCVFFFCIPLTNKTLLLFIVENVGHL